MEKLPDFVTYRLSDGIGWQIRHFRRFYKFSQEELGYKIGVSQRMVSLWEHSRAVPSLKNFLMLSSIFGEDFYNSCIICNRVHRL